MHDQDDRFPDVAGFGTIYRFAAFGKVVGMRPVID